MKTRMKVMILSVALTLAAGCAGEKSADAAAEVPVAAPLKIREGSGSPLRVLALCPS